ncbi:MULTISPECIES: aKG-HExxH-type peptide beta-hydroxylase [Streptomyces]|uniref:HEXXH motif-containing putative peptide modification protein n=1 Tax=Streptomyces ramulosus TaxID=47762 RepID=A0ABW1FEV3_9ACTN
MDIPPDAQATADDQRGLARQIRTTLRRAGLLEAGTISERDLLRPAVVDTAHRAQRGIRQGTPPPALRGDLARALTAADRPRPSHGVNWPVELAGPQPHLHRSVRRALASLPAPAPRHGDAAPATAELVSWQAAEAETFEAATRLLSDVWPEMLAELRCLVVELALLEGRAIDGFTDFAVHGAIMLNRRRLTTSRAGLPGPVRLAEALVHEGTHQRCNVAATARPFLRAGKNEEAGLLETPLRTDPRPLTGLFQQTVVLARSLLLFGRLLRSSPGSGAEPLKAREDRLRTAADQAVGTLSAHRGALTPHGCALLDRATALVRAGR